MATHRADDVAARTRRSSIESAIDRATAALEQFQSNVPLPTVDETIDACGWILLVNRLVSSVGSWTEEHLVVEVSQHHRQKLEWLLQNRDAPFRAQIRGRSESLRVLLDEWPNSCGDGTEPAVPANATEEQRAAAYVIAMSLNLDLADICKLREECRELGLGANFLDADWPVAVDGLELLRERFGAIEEVLADDRGIRFGWHLERRSHDGVGLPPTLQSAFASVLASPWGGAEVLWKLHSGARTTDKERAVAWRGLAVFGLERVEWFAQDNPDSDFARLFDVFGQELLAVIDSEEFWYVVGRGFFRPGDWASCSAYLRPVIAHAGVLLRLGLDRELKELNENFILGNWIAVMALARVVMERVLKERLGLPPEAQKSDLETLVNRFCDRLPDPNLSGIRSRLHRLRNAANDRLHRREEEWLHLRGEVLRFDEDKLEARARESIDTLHRLFGVIERLPEQ